ncbi:MFS transporter [Oerskovia flava]|uniref:MFS transporter n=1 Tax=Oerskovia flava TaxID=2986422 RepID=UPI0022407135|nr:MFS transporter [Oerskovia sp. JB1-3-2]
MPIGQGFRALWGANASSNLADGLAFVSMPLLAASLTDDPRLVAGLATVYALVRLLVALPVGVWVDRVDRRTLMVAGNLLRAGVVVALAVSVQTEQVTLPLLYAVLAVVGTLESAADDAAFALLPSIVEHRDLDRANGRLSATQLVADEFLGPPLGGFLFAVGAAVPVFAMGGLWAAAGAVALALPVRRVPVRSDGATPVRRSMLGEAVEGARWLRRDRVVGGLAVVGALASVGYMLPFAILVLFAQERLGVGSLGYGLILAVSALGGLAGALTAASLRARLGYRWTVVASLLTGAVSLLCLALTTHAVLAAVLLAVYVLHAVVWSVCATSIRQRLVPDLLRGRVNGATRVLSLLGLVVGSAAGGLLGGVDLALAVAAGGLVFVVCAVVAGSVLRGVDAADPGAGPVRLR